MYINHRRVINTKSKVVHGVYPDNRSTFCGFPEAHVPSKADPRYASSAVDVDFIVKSWSNWEETDEETTCKTCRWFLAKREAI